MIGWSGENWYMQPQFQPTIMVIEPADWSYEYKEGVKVVPFGFSRALAEDENVQLELFYEAE